MDVGLNKEETKNLKVTDFKFEYIDKENKILCDKIKKFIERHEWLGKMPTRPTHRFIATYRDHLAGVVVMATPNSFSNLLGKENRHLEKLISRGACISWSPKNLASSLIMYSIRHMVKNTEFRFFTAYSDTEARELGTIYQACNFIYLGQSHGAKAEYFDPSSPQKGWFSDRQFRKLSQVRRYANELKILWQDHWSLTDKILWKNIAFDIKQQLKQSALKHKSLCLCRELRPKHKYLYILGRSKNETKKLKKKFQDLNPHLLKLSYPKFRGPLVQTENNTAVLTPGQHHNPLTESWNTSRPQNSEPILEFISVKAAAEILNLSVWSIYKLIAHDQSFPALNVGLKKKWVIDQKKLIGWVQDKTKKTYLNKNLIPTAFELITMKGK